MSRIHRNLTPQQSYWINNGRLADEIIMLIAKDVNEEPNVMIGNIKKIVFNYKKKVIDNPKITKALVELLEDLIMIKTDNITKLQLILDAATITINLRNLKTENINTTTTLPPIMSF